MQHFKGSFIFTAICLVLSAIWEYYNASGNINAILSGVFIACILGVLEVSLSFDNAVVNAAVLETMDPVWQRRFLTWGILIAVFGMRVVFPIVIVSVVAWIDPISVMKMALTTPDVYSEHLTKSHAVISSFGGMFLLMVFLKFIIDEEKETHWIKGLEEKLSSLGKLESFEILIAMFILLLGSYISPEHEKAAVLVSGLAGLITYISIDALSSYLEGTEEKMLADGVKKGGIAMFIYLEVLDASFSFDGVIGAFAITKDIVIIALGLGIGAMFVRSLTLFLVKKGTLQEYIYLEHGAHYAIGLLAVIMIASIKYHIPEVFTGLSGVLFIVVALISSISYNKKQLQNQKIETISAD